MELLLLHDNDLKRTICETICVHHRSARPTLIGLRCGFGNINTLHEEMTPLLSRIRT